MNTVWILFVVLSFNGGTTSFNKTFGSQQACETAKENIRQKTSSARFLLLTCEKL